MNATHEYRARQTMPILDWQAGRWATVGSIAAGERFHATDHYLPNGGMVLLLADGRGMVDEWCDELPEIIR